MEIFFSHVSGLVTAACSDKDQEGKTFLQLKITYKHKEEINNLYLEMGLNQFYTFLHELEKSKNIILNNKEDSLKLKPWKKKYANTAWASFQNSPQPDTDDEYDEGPAASERSEASI